MFAYTQTRSFKIRTVAWDIVTAKYISLGFESRVLGDGDVVCDIVVIWRLHFVQGNKAHSSLRPEEGALVTTTKKFIYSDSSQEHHA